MTEGFSYRGVEDVNNDDRFLGTCKMEVITGSAPQLPTVTRADSGTPGAPVLSGLPIQWVSDPEMSCSWRFRKEKRAEPPAYLSNPFSHLEINMIRERTLGKE